MRNLASVPVEAIPTAGVVVVVGVTTLELKEACETMKDMTELNQIMGIEAPPDQEEVCGLKVPTPDEVMDQVLNSPRAIWESMSNWDLELPSWDQWGDKLNSMKDSVGKVWSDFKSLL